ncbi:Eco57I restriction-modification methylase domain-containing protein [Sphingomonas sp. SORGH_AS_0438]|uniref:Eco57I restriction-modification methylase domain-containing protein n=1 Tax=Sphingomonas sp. SORGH_AS_0438 TaxID=3041756 RepID=UPI002860A18A|nr:N-6 DNA methylase [Sphingomonas sp. SORGH_AS_0438]MDR6129080.1 adenine-specific DNA-methyltransferase [Sphingomonas sp. SORGH_AS_0438]
MSLAPALPRSLPADLEAQRYELARARQLARAWAETLPEPRRRDMAALFTRIAIDTYQAEARPYARLSAPFAKPYGRLDRAVAELAQVVGREAAPLPIAEAAYFLTGLYTTLLHARERGALGAFYTPPVLANRLLDMAEEQGIDWTRARVLDPASGGGAFLLPAAERMVAALPAAEPAIVLRQIGTRLVGLELDPYAAGFGQNAVELLLADVTAAAGRLAPVVVRVADTLEEAPAARFDLVIGNPPYGRITLTPEQRQRFARSLYGHANLYGVFTDIAVRWAKKGGTIAYLTPTSFLSGHYYSALRELIAKEAPPVAIDFVHARRGVFEDVLQETLLAAYKRGAKAVRAQVHYVEVANEREARVIRNGTIGLPSPASQPWLAPREPRHSPLIAAAEAMPARLADWGYSVSTGPLVWNRYKDQMRLRPARGVHPLIWAEAVSADGHFAFRAEKRNHAPYFKIERGDAWLLVEEACVLVQRTTAKEQARRLIAAELPAEFIVQHGGVVVENHLNMVRPTAQPAVSPATVAAVLNSRIVDQLFRCINGSVAVSAFEMEALPLPSPDAMGQVEALVARGACSAEIEGELARLYGQVTA